jgi:hypothetical protein
MSSWINFRKKKNECEIRGEETQKTDRTACISKQSRFYLSRTARVVFSSLLLVESLLPVSAETQKAKDFKNQMVNSIKVENMGKSGTMAQAGAHLEVENLQKRINEEYSNVIKNANEAFNDYILLNTQYMNAGVKDRKKMQNELTSQMEKKNKEIGNEISFVLNKYLPFRQKNPQVSTQNFEGVRQIFNKYTKRQFIEDAIKALGEIKLDREDKQFLEGVEKQISELERYGKEMKELGVPEIVIRKILDASRCFFEEWKYFYSLAKKMGDNDTAKEMRKSFFEQKPYDMVYAALGYGSGYSYYLVPRAEDTQLGILYRVLKNLKDEGYDIRKIDWEEVSTAEFDKGNPLAGTDYPYTRGRGYYLSDYKGRMYNLLKDSINKTIKSGKEIKNINIESPGIDPQDITIKDPILARLYGDIKVYCYNSIIELIKRYPVAQPLTIDLITMINKIIVRGYDQYISNPNIQTSKALVESLNTATETIRILEIVLNDINTKTEEMMKTIRSINKAVKKGEYSKLFLLEYDPSVTNFIIDSIKNKDIALEPQKEEDLNKLQRDLVKALLHSSLPGFEEKTDFKVSNPWFKYIYIVNQDKAKAKIGIPQAKTLIAKKINSLTLVPKDVMQVYYPTNEKEGAPKYVSQKNEVTASFHISVFSFKPGDEAGKGSYIKSDDIDPNSKIILKPFYKTIDWTGSPGSDSIDLYPGLFDQQFLKENGWNDLGEGVYEKNKVQLAVSPKTVNIYPYYPLPVINKINVARPYYSKFSKDKPGEFEVNISLIPPGAREIYFKLEPDNNSSFFKAGDKKSSSIYVEADPAIVIPLLPSRITSNSVSLSSIDSNAFSTISKNFNVNIELLNKIDGLSKDVLTSAEKGNPDVEKKFNNLIELYRPFAGQVYQKAKNDPNLSTEEKQYINDFSTGKVTDLNRLIDIFRKVDPNSGLLKMFPENINLVSKVVRDINFSVVTASFFEPVNLGLFDLSAIIYGRQEKTLKVTGTRKITSFNPDGTSTTETSPWEYKDAEIGDLYGFQLDINSKKKQIGKVNLIWGDEKTFLGQYEGVGRGLLNLPHVDSVGAAVKELAKNLSINYSTYDLSEKRFEYLNFGLKFGFTTVPARFFDSLIKVVSGKDYYSRADLEVGLVYNINKEEGIKPIKKLGLNLGETFDFGLLDVYASYDTLGRSWKAGLQYDASRALGIPGSKFGLDAVWNGDKNAIYNITVMIPFLFKKSKK